MTKWRPCVMNPTPTPLFPPPKCPCWRSTAAPGSRTCGRPAPSKAPPACTRAWPPPSDTWTTTCSGSGWRRPSPPAYACRGSLSRAGRGERGQVRVVGHDTTHRYGWQQWSTSVAKRSRREQVVFYLYLFFILFYFILFLELYSSRRKFFSAFDPIQACPSSGGQARSSRQPLAQRPGTNFGCSRHWSDDALLTSDDYNRSWSPGCQLV